MKIYALYQGDQYLYDGTLRELSLRSGMLEDYIEIVLTQVGRIERAITNGDYDSLFIAVEVENDEWYI